MENDILEMKDKLTALRVRLDNLESEQHSFDKQIVEIRADLHYIKVSQDTLNTNLSRFLWIVGGGFIASVVGFIIRGGLSVGQ
jgi:chromosome segregation ATPase